MREQRRNNTWVFIAIILIMIVVFTVAILYLLSKLNNKQEITEINNLSISTDSKKLPKAQEIIKDKRISFTGIPDSAIHKNTTVQLQNQKENEDFMMEYLITDESSNLIYKTDLIRAGEYIEWCPGNYLDFGTHKLQITQQPYCLVDDKWFPITPSTNVVTIAIVE